YIHENRPLEIVAARVAAVGRSDTRLDPSHRAEAVGCEPHGFHALLIDGQPKSAALYDREKLLPGAQLTGPAVIVEALTTTIIDPGWQATVLSAGELLIEADNALFGHDPNLHLARNPVPNPSLTRNPTPAPD